MKTKDIVKVLLANGFVLERQKGPHYVYRCQETRKIFMVPKGKKVTGGRGSNVKAYYRKQLVAVGIESVPF